MAIAQLHHTLSERVKVLLPDERVTRVRTLVWLLCGLVNSGSVHLAAIGGYIPGTSTQLSKVRKLARWLDNRHVCVRSWYKPVAVQLLAAAARDQLWVRLVIDATKVSQTHQLLMVALVTRRRTLPIAWTWVRCRKGHSSADVQHDLFQYVYDLLPAEAHARVMVLGDSEFAPLQSRLTQWGWSYALRQKGSYLVRTSPNHPWQRCDELVTGPGQCCWLTNVELTRVHNHPTNLLALWLPGEKRPWLIATNLPTRQATRLHYSRRMWIEEMFGDFKRHGFDLEATCLRHAERLSRLTLAVALLYVWLFALGAKVIKRGQRRLVDRNDRRDLSVFRIGSDFLKRCIANQSPCPLPPVPYLS